MGNHVWFLIRNVGGLLSHSRQPFPPLGFTNIISGSEGQRVATMVWQPSTEQGKEERPFKEKIIITKKRYGTVAIEIQ